jgi:hypothetical protein
MGQAYPAFHALKVRPKTFMGIYAEHIRNAKKNYESGHREEHQGTGRSEGKRYAWTNSGVPKRKDKPQRKDDLDNNPEGKVLTRDEWEKQRVRDNKRSEEYGEYSPDNPPP